MCGRGVWWSRRGWEPRAHRRVDMQWLIPKWQWCKQTVYMLWAVSCSGPSAARSPVVHAMQCSCGRAGHHVEVGGGCRSEGVIRVS
jgi:hypothetical protein